MFESGHWKSPTLTQSQYDFISQLVQCHPANIDLHATGDQVQLLGVHRRKLVRFEKSMGRQIGWPSTPLVGFRETESRRGVTRSERPPLSEHLTGNQKECPNK